jgi:hypothetical protein
MNFKRLHIIKCLFVGHKNITVFDPHLATNCNAFVAIDKVYCERCGKFLYEKRIMTSCIH